MADAKVDRMRRAVQHHGARFESRAFTNASSRGLAAQSDTLAHYHRHATHQAVCQLFGGRDRGCALLATRSLRPQLVGLTHDADGWGFNVLEVIKIVAISATNNLTFGGLDRGNLQGEVVQHNVPVFSCTARFFGVSRNVLFNEHPPSHSSAVVLTRSCTPTGARKTSAMIARCFPLHRTGMLTTGFYEATNKARLSGRGLVMRDSPRLTDAELSPRVRELLRRQVFPQLLPHASFTFTLCHASKPAITLAIHMRRGDIAAATHRGMFEEDQVFLDQISRIRALYPHVEVHVYSSSKRGAEPQEAFEAMRQVGAVLHLDRPIFETVADATLATIYVMSKGTFSMIPAILSEGCVVAVDWLHILPLNGWLTRSWSAQQLKGCLASRLSPERLCSHHKYYHPPSTASAQTQGSTRTQC